MTDNNKSYQQPKMKVVEFEIRRLICQHSVEGGFSLGDGGTIGRGNDSDWDENGGW